MEDIAAALNARGAGVGGLDMGFDLGVEFEIIEEVDGEPIQDPLEPPQRNEGNADAPDLQDNAPEPPEPGLFEFRHNISSAALATTVVSAIFMPAVASTIGDLLKLVLPRKFTTKPLLHARWPFGGVEGSATGLLQEKWGRSIVGGCLFVVLKDVAVLYCKWRKARDFGKRRVLNNEKKRRQTS